MRKLKNVLYITSPDAFVSAQGEALKINFDDKPPVKLPAHNLEGIVQFSYPGMSPYAMSLCSKMGITVTFLTPNGKFLARVEGPQSGNILLRRQQYRLYEKKWESAKMSSRFIAAKLINSRQVLARAKRDYENKISIDLSPAIDKLKELSNLAYQCIDEEQLRGIEGDAAREYFKALSHLIFVDKENFYITSRNKRPPLDNMNCLLSYLYTLLAHECRSACESVGLDPAAGYLHKDRPGRPSLALDLMEEFRAVFADRMALSLVNRKQITADNFTKQPQGEVRMNDEGKKTVLETWQNRKQTIIQHPFLNEKVEFGLLPYTQALLLSRYVRGDLEDYPAFLWR